MEKIYIKDSQSTSVIYLNSKFYTGYTIYKDGRIKAVDKNIFDRLSFFKLSNNRKYLPNEGKYQVILDENTNFKHYFINGKEDYVMFYKNNGENAILCKGNIDIATRKLFVFTTVAVSLPFMLLNTAFTDSIGKTYKAINHLENYLFYSDIEEITPEYIKEALNKSKLNEEQKKYLYSEDFFRDILPYVNKNRSLMLDYCDKFSCVEAKYYDRINNLLGYYDPCFPSKIHLSNDDTNPDDTLAHEFIHLCQNNYDYRVIAEACAEIFSYEYYNGTSISAYHSAISAVSSLIEVIGTEPILEYNFIGSFNGISNSVKPYLNEQQYEQFLRLCKRDVCPRNNYAKEDSKKIDEDMKELRKLVSIIAQNKGLDYEYVGDTKYYFNKNHIKHALINNRSNYLYKPIKLEELMNSGLKIIFNKDYIGYDELYPIILNHTYLEASVFYDIDGTMYPIDTLCIDVDDNDIPYVKMIIPPDSEEFIPTIQIEYKKHYVKTYGD